MSMATTGITADIKQFKFALSELKEKVLVASQQKVDLKKIVSNGSYIYDYKFNKAKYLADRIKKSAGDLVAQIEKAHKNNKNTRLTELINKLVVNSKFIQEGYLEPLRTLPIIEQAERELKELEKLEELETEIREFEKEAAARPIAKNNDNDGRARETMLNFELPELPEEIAEEINADVQELRKCFNSECYRSSIILCGRIIETALHRKYFDVTGNDALEKEPGIGLGKLVARMSEKGVRLDPALPQQIQFINQVRTFSVHTKQQTFNPSKNQAQATILYTMDVVGRLV
jgi:hypothetical protein